MIKQHTIIFNRKEVDWLYRRVNGAFKRADEILTESHKGGEQSEPQKLVAKEAQDNIEMLKKQSHDMASLITDGLTRLGALGARRAELEEALSFTEEPASRTKISDELAALPIEEEYRVTMDRHAIKYIISIVDDMLMRLRTKIIPEYQNAPVEHYENAERVMSRSYYVNKNLRMKVMLEDMQRKLEKRL